MALDLLSTIHSRGLPLEIGESILDNTIANGGIWWEELQISRWEATAYAHGAMLQELLRLRYEGWPTVCARCGQPIDYTKFGWWFSVDESGHLTLTHINELPEA